MLKDPEDGKKALVMMDDARFSLPFSTSYIVVCTREPRILWCIVE
jgi:hypothetical protein